MGKKRPLIIAGLALGALAAAILAITLTGPAKDRPTLVYFRADL
jgi:hypothetical protein